jgi:hypothetical protein
MKKLVVLAVLTMALVAIGVTPAAAAPKCITLTNFCDRIEFNSDSSGNTYGVWDWVCDGINLTSIIGRSPGRDITMNTRPVYAGFPFQYSADFAFHKASGLFDLYGTDGTVIFPFQTNQPYSITNASCGFAGVRVSLKPRLTDRK